MFLCPTTATMCWRAVLLIFLATYVFAKVDYTGHRVLSITPSSDAEIRKIYKIFEDHPELELDIWSEVPMEGTIAVRVPPQSFHKFLHILRAISPNSSYAVVIENVQSLIDQEAASTSLHRSGYGDFAKRRYTRSLEEWRRTQGDEMPRPTSPPRWIVNETLNTLFNTITTFPRHQEILDWIDNMADLLPQIGKTESIGKSSQGRDLKVIWVGKPREDGVAKQTIFIDALIHAREWVTQSTALYMIFQLMSKYGIDDKITTLVDTFDWCFLPVFNPDGYEYTHEQDRIWRKSRTNHGNSHCNGRHRNCYGTDLNRNFGYHWKNATNLCSSNGPCSQFYGGPQPFSERETEMVARYMLQHHERIIMYLSLHSDIQRWLTPWGHTIDQPDDYEDVIRVAQAASKALQDVHGTKFEAVAISKLYNSINYTTYGNSIDWAKGVAGIKYSFAPELRGKKGYTFFIIGKDQLIPAGEETWAGVTAAVDEIMEIEGIAPYQPPHPQPQSLHLPRNIEELLDAGVELLSEFLDEGTEESQSDRASTTSFPTGSDFQPDSGLETNQETTNRETQQRETEHRQTHHMHPYGLETLEEVLPQHQNDYARPMEHSGHRASHRLDDGLAHVLLRNDDKSPSAQKAARVSHSPTGGSESHEAQSRVSQERAHHTRVQAQTKAGEHRSQRQEQPRGRDQSDHRDQPGDQAAEDEQPNTEPEQPEHRHHSGHAADQRSAEHSQSSGTRHLARDGSNARMDISDLSDTSDFADTRSPWLPAL